MLAEGRLWPSDDDDDDDVVVHPLSLDVASLAQCHCSLPALVADKNQYIYCYWDHFDQLVTQYASLVHLQHHSIGNPFAACPNAPSPGFHRDNGNGDNYDDQ